MFVCVYVAVLVCASERDQVHNQCMYACMNEYVCVCVYVYVFVYVNIYGLVKTIKLTYIHTCIHTYIQTGAYPSTPMERYPCGGTTEKRSCIIRH